MFVINKDYGIDNNLMTYTSVVFTLIADNVVTKVDFSLNDLQKEKPRRLVWALYSKRGLSSSE